MRVLEIVFLALTVAALIGLLKDNAGKSRVFSVILGCTFLALMLHLIIEGWRWQVVPGYGAGAAILIISAKRMFRKHDADDQRRKWFRTALKFLLSGTAMILVLISGILSWAFPVFKLPDPTGPYRVGQSQWFLLDKSREETQTVEPGDCRELSVLSWYPAEATGMTKMAEYFPKGIAKAILADSHASSLLGLARLRETGVGFFFDYMRLVHTHAYPNAAVSPKHPPYPVLVFSHGYGALPAQNTVLMEELASHGYAVFSIGHTYESLVEIFPDGRKIRYSPRFSVDSVISKLGNEIEKSKVDDLAALIAIFKRYNTTKAFESIPIWLADTRFVIDWLEEKNAKDPESPFYGRLDLTKLGVLGMSYGGSTACQIAFEDQRVKAVINMDGGTPLGDSIDYSFDIPVMFMKSEPPLTVLAGTHRKMIEYMMGRTHNAFYSIFVSGARHLNFTDISIFSPVLKYTSEKIGNIDGDKMLNIMNCYIVAFFDKHLKGIDSPLLNGPSADFPEVIFKARIPHTSD